MRIAIDFTGPLGGDTGGATYARYFLPSWRAQFDDQVTAVFSNGQVPRALEGVDGVVECRAPDVKPALARALDRYVTVPREVSRAHPDVAYFPGNFVSLGIPREIPVAVAVRSLLYYHYPGQVTRTRYVYRRAATAYAVRRADRIVVPSSVTADELMRRLRVPRHRIVVVAHGVDLEAFRPAEDPPSEPGRFLFVSKPWDYKGLATVIRALALVCADAPEADVKLMVADGGITEADRDSWLGLASALGMAGRVQFLGRIAHEQLPLEYRRASALVLPTSYESFGNPFMEAAASGCPVITASGHAMPETIGPVATLVPPHRHSDVAEAMLSCLRMSAAERQERALALRAWAERFPWSRTVFETRQALAEVSSSGGAGRQGRASPSLA